MRKITIAAVATAASAMAVALPAYGHVTLRPDEAPAGGFARLDVRVPNERDRASTERVRVQFPPGFIFISYEPVAGWDVEVKKRRLREPVEAFGEEVTEEVAEVSFTARDGAAIRPGQFRDFGLSLGIPDRSGTKLTFKSLQTYSNGEVVRWIGPPDSEEPAPQVNVVAAAEPSSSAAESDRKDGEDDEGPSTGLVVAALGLGGAGLLTGAGALLTTRRREE